MSVHDTLKAILPYFTSGTVITGFGRGSKQLGCPTANLPPEVVARLPPPIACGVYFGWASVDNGPVHKMVTSIGYNPQFGNAHKTIVSNAKETHILHQFPDDFYGSWLKIAFAGYLRPMEKYSGLDELIAAIEKDKKDAAEQLDLPEYSTLQTNPFFGQRNDSVQSPGSHWSDNVATSASGQIQSIGASTSTLASHGMKCADSNEPQRIANGYDGVVSESEPHESRSKSASVPGATLGKHDDSGISDCRMGDTGHVEKSLL